MHMRLSNNNNNNNNGTQIDRQTDVCLGAAVITQLCKSSHHKCTIVPGGWLQSMPANLSHKSAITVTVYTHHCCGVLFSPKTDSHFAAPRRVEGRVDLCPNGLHVTSVFIQ